MNNRINRKINKARIRLQRPEHTETSQACVL